MTTKSLSYDGMHYVSLRATTELIDRKQELEKINAAIAAHGPRVVYVMGDGGLGKTRLLQEVLKVYKDKKHEEGKKPIFTNLIDLYYIEHHTPEGLATKIADHLGEENFKKYAGERARLWKSVERGTVSASEIAKQRSTMLQAFVDDLNTLSDAQPVVLVLDTAETLVYEDDELQTLLMPAREGWASVSEWLVSEFLPDLRNVIVLIAGRKESKRLAQAIETRLGARYELIALKPFDADSCEQYLRAVEEAARTENNDIAERIAQIPANLRRMMFEYSNGEPFLLALMIDYLAMSGEPLPRELADPSASLQPLSEEERKAYARAMLIQHIQTDERFRDDILRFIALTPKGMNATLLAWIQCHHQPEEAEIQAAGEKLQRLLHKDKRLSFVKIRPDDQTVFYQDEMYRLLRSVQRFSPAAAKQIYADILNYYQWRIECVQDDIRFEYEAQFPLGVQDRPIADTELAPILVENETIVRLRGQLATLQVEQVYYALQKAFFTGLEHLERYEEEAFQNNDASLWLELRDELLKYVAAAPEERHKVREYVETFSGIGWVKRSIQLGDYKKALEQIKIFRHHLAGVSYPTQYVTARLIYWEAWVLTYQGQPEKAREILSPLLDDETEEAAELDFDHWRALRLRAGVYAALGYASRAQGRFHSATTEYKKAIVLMRQLSFKAEHANALNNLSWAEAEIGHFTAAIQHCQDALALRRKDGRPFGIALSLNTLGKIETRNDQPNRARLHCETALSIFRALESNRGIGLACTALAEALRRQANLDLYSKDVSSKLLQRAQEYAEESAQIFREDVKEPLSLIEALIEVGCVHRELVRGYVVEKKQEEIDRHKRASEAAFEELVEIATDGAFKYRAVDAYVNWMWLYYYAGESEQVDKIGNSLIEEIPPEYLFVPKEAPRTPESPQSWFWVQLGKARLLYGMVHFDAYCSERAELKRKGLAAEDARPQLAAAFEDWALSLAYNRRYSDSFRDLERAVDHIYRAAKVTSYPDLVYAYQRLDDIYDTYCIPEKWQYLKKILPDMFGELV